MPEEMTKDEVPEKARSMSNTWLSGIKNGLPAMTPEMGLEIKIQLMMMEANAKRLVAGACVVCSNAEDSRIKSYTRKTVKPSEVLREWAKPMPGLIVKPEGGIITQKQLELCHKDIEFSPYFEKCKVCGECKPEIENNEWQGYDPHYVVGDGYGLNKDEAYMICVNGGGYLYPSEDGQLNCMREYGIWLKENPQEEKEEAVEVFALACSGRGENAGSLSQDQKEKNAQYMYKYLENEGWSREAICGVFGNMDEESGMNPGVWQNMDQPETGYGLVQWSEAKELLDATGLTVKKANELAQTDPQKLMDIELDYLLDTYEKRWYPNLAGPYLDKRPVQHGTESDISFEEFSTSDADPGDLAVIFNATYERSADGKEGIEERVDAAERWYEYFSD